ncbi:MAG: hypothetical protein OHK0039_22770 [Bacteroidia bacterium]
MKNSLWSIAAGLLLLGLGCQSGSSTATGGDDSTADTTACRSLRIAADSFRALDWGVLQEDIAFEDKYFEDIDQYLLFPSFGDSVRSFDRQPVRIAGYVLTVEPGRYVLSANPFSSCFFCGGAGPESVMELVLCDPEQIFFTDEWRSFSGYLTLNDTNVDMLNYIMQEAVADQP